ncbi:MFS transporter [Nocardioides sp. AE5]|uniref:MFS transporter n=1 Tax=Nocardioides sp. AE5 TaxID=2962573 RepID=UPI0028825149|nr:MFS transporter [Nocardioides sp. AE5]MDT0200718.1 MFS transporter [Nocardioides sp. AE5]
MTTARAQLHDIGGRRAWVIWVVAVTVYMLAVFHRSSLGVAGLIALDRFSITGTELAFFTVLQLVVYAGMQVPVGVLLDRYGSRALLISGLVMMTLAQLAFAFTTSFGAAVVARALVGAGDAMVFVSVLRLVSAWFLVRQGSMLAQVTGLVGQMGAIIAAAPLSLVLHEFGWTKAFAGVSMIGVPLLVATACLVKDSPYERSEVVRVKVRALANSVRLVWGNPGTRLGMWSHFTSQFSMTVFALLWGYPFLVAGQGLTSREAGVLLTVMTAWVMVSGVVLGRLVSVVPFYRSWIVVGIVLAIATTWSVVLLWPGPAPMWLLVVLVCVTGSGGPASMVGFDLARSFTPAESLGRANGLVNIGGFVASLATMAAIGVILDLLEPRGADFYTLADFRVALCAQYAFWALGVVQILRYRRSAVAHLERLHPGAVEAMKRGEPFVHPGFNDREGV